MEFLNLLPYDIHFINDFSTSFSWHKDSVELAAKTDLTLKVVLGHCLGPAMEALRKTVWKDLGADSEEGVSLMNIR